MSLTELFERLGAPLVNSRWSWGSVDADGNVLLRVWQDRVKRFDGRQMVEVWDQGRHEADPGNPGRNERLRHIEMVGTGAPCYMIMCIAKDPGASTRKIKSFIERNLFVGGAPEKNGGRWWIPITNRVPVAHALPRTVTR